MYCQGPSGLGLDWDQTDLDGPWRSQSQKFCLGPDCPVSGPAKMARDRTRPNFPNTTPHNAAMHESGTSMRMTQEDVSGILIESVIEDIWFVACPMPSESNGGGPMRHTVRRLWAIGN